MSDEGMSDDDVRAVLRSAAMICAVHAPSESGLQPALHAIAARLDTLTATIATVTVERDAARAIDYSGISLSMARMLSQTGFANDRTGMLRNYIEAELRSHLDKLTANHIAPQEQQP